MSEERKRSDPTVSILLPTYNSGTYLKTQITSILEQTFGDFELLVFDDGSSDGTLALLQKFAAMDRRLQVSFTAVNEGQNRALSRLLKQARGRYIAFSDHDDIWHFQKLERLHDVISLKAVGLVFGGSHLIDAEGQSLGVTLHEEAKLELRPEDRLRLLFFPLVSGHAALVDRSLIWDGSFSGSMLFDGLIALDAQFTSGIAFEPRAVTFHRIHGKNLSNSDLQRGIRDVRRWRNVRYPRALLSSGNEDRMLFFKRVTYLGQSLVIPRSVQRAFQDVAATCEMAWFAAPLRCSAYQARCRAALHTKLLPLAANEQDEALARQTFAALCSPFRRRRSFTIAR